jgi:hypothetical protein
VELQKRAKREGLAGNIYTHGKLGTHLAQLIFHLFGLGLGLSRKGALGVTEGVHGEQKERMGKQTLRRKSTSFSQALPARTVISTKIRARRPGE